jgi:hypothetical protein
VYKDKRQQVVLVLTGSRASPGPSERYLFGPMPELHAVLLAQMVELVWSKKYSHQDRRVAAVAVPVNDGNLSALEVLAHVGVDITDEKETA